jgi:hypothetical protein
MQAVRLSDSLVLKNAALSVRLAGVMGDEGRLTRIMKRAGVGRVELDTLSAGDIASIAGMPTAGIADTVADIAAREGLDPGAIEPPTMRFAQETVRQPSRHHLLSCSSTASVRSSDDIHLAAQSHCGRKPRNLGRTVRNSPMQHSDIACRRPVERLLKSVSH